MTVCHFRSFRLLLKCAVIDPLLKRIPHLKLWEDRPSNPLRTQPMHWLYRHIQTDVHNYTRRPRDVDEINRLQSKSHRGKKTDRGCT